MNSAAALAAFSEHVATDPALRAQLAACPDPAAFATACVAAGQELELHFSTAEVRELLQARHLHWLQRHLL